MNMRIGILSLQGDFAEHSHATLSAAYRLKMPCTIVHVRTKEQLEGLDGLIMPGGESTTMSKLLLRKGMFSEISKIPKILGTCAGAIMMAKKVEGAIPGQHFLSLMDIGVKRNAYGSQASSFQMRLKTSLGDVDATFIRAPLINFLGENVKPLAYAGENPVAAYEQVGNSHYLACAFHPELSTTLFHEFFLKLGSNEIAQQ